MTIRPTCGARCERINDEPACRQCGARPGDNPPEHPLRRLHAATQRVHDSIIAIITDRRNP